MLALGTLVYDHFRPVNTWLVITTCAIAAVIARMAMTFRRTRPAREEPARRETDTLTA